MMAVNELKSEKVGVINNGMYRQLWGIKLFGGNIEEVLKVVEDRLKLNSVNPYWIATVNPEFMVKAMEDKGFFDILQKTNLNVIDGVGLVWAIMVKQGGKPIKIGVEIMQGRHREMLVPGVELMERLCVLAARNNKTVYFFGGWGDRAGRTADYMIKKYPGLKVVGFKDEDFDFETKADFLFVARGMKKQEEWIDQNIDQLKVGVVMGVGRSFDYFSGDLERAPEIWRKMGLEWLYSLYKEPSRWKRQLALPRFVLRVLKFA